MPAQRKKSRRDHHCVYVVLLSEDVIYEPKFRRCNPDYDPGKPCVYVGKCGMADGGGRKADGTRNGS